MPAPTPPTPIAAVPATPDRNEGEDVFVPKMYTFLDYFAPFKAYLQLAVTYCADAITWATTLVGMAQTSETNAAASAGLSATAVINAQNAQAAAEYVAGLPPVNTIGQIFHTQPVLNVKSTAFTATTGNIYDIDSSGGAFDITLKASPSVGDWHEFYDYSGTFNVGLPVVKRNGQLIMGLAEDCTLTNKYSSPRFVFRGGSRGWVIQ